MVRCSPQADGTVSGQVQQISPSLAIFDLVGFGTTKITCSCNKRVCVHRFAFLDAFALVRCTHGPTGHQPGSTCPCRFSWNSTGLGTPDLAQLIIERFRAGTAKVYPVETAPALLDGAAGTATLFQTAYVGVTAQVGHSAMRCKACGSNIPEFEGTGKRYVVLYDVMEKTYSRHPRLHTFGYYGSRNKGSTIGLCPVGSCLTMFKIDQPGRDNGGYFRTPGGSAPAWMIAAYPAGEVGVNPSVPEHDREKLRASLASGARDGVAPKLVVSAAAPAPGRRHGHDLPRTSSGPTWQPPAGYDYRTFSYIAANEAAADAAAATAAATTAATAAATAAATTAATTAAAAARSGGGAAAATSPPTPSRARQQRPPFSEMMAGLKTLLALPAKPIAPKKLLVAVRKELPGLLNDDGDANLGIIEQLSKCWERCHE